MRIKGPSPRTKARIRRTAQYALLMGASFVVTAFVLLNGYELAFSKDLPYADALKEVPVQSFISRNLQEKAAADPAAAAGSFGKPVSLKLATRTTKLEVVPATQKNGQYLARAAAAHYAYLTLSKGGTAGNIALYVRQSWRTILEPAELKPGGNLFLDTDHDWRYMYRIAQNVALPADAPYVIPDGVTSHLVLAIVDPSSQRITYVTGDFVSIQNISQ